MCTPRDIYHPRGVKVLHCAQYDLTRPPSRLLQKLRTRKNGRYPGGLAHVVRGVFDTVIANRRQPQQPKGGEVGGIPQIMI